MSWVSTPRNSVRARVAAQKCCDSSSVGRAEPCQGSGRRFEPDLSLKCCFLFTFMYTHRMKPKLQLVTPEFAERYFAEKELKDRKECARIRQNIECPTCQFPASESHYWLSHLNPGIASGPDGKVLRDPGCEYDLIK